MDLQRLFFPESIAVVGASPNLDGGKLPYYHVLRESGYKGRLYPVNHAHKEINGVKVYPSLEALPESVDLAIVSVPARMALETLKAAVKRGIKFVHFFTAGFSEMGESELEKAMLRLARKGGTRIVGPNCIGVHCTESRVTFEMFFSQTDPGNVAFLSQSGGVCNDFVRLAKARHLRLNKAVSYGNQIDIKVEDYLGYLAQDQSVTAIAAYIEDVKNGKNFLDTLKQTTSLKPVVILKGGMTEAGAKAAASHTGAMAGHHHVWSAAMRQHRCIQVETFEQMLQVLMLATSNKIPEGPRIGFLGAGGGTSVLFTDLAVKHGLSLPELEGRTRRCISERIGQVNTSTANPVDLGAYGFDFDILAHTIEAMDADDHIDTILAYFPLDFIKLVQIDQIETGPHTIVKIARTLRHPLISILSRLTEEDIHTEELRIRIFSIFRDAGLPVYSTSKEAIEAVSGILQWRKGFFKRKMV